MNLDKLLKILNERQSVNEMPFETGVKQADDESDPNLTPAQLKAMKARHKSTRAEHKAEGDSSTSVGYSKRKGAQEAGDPKGLEKTRPKKPTAQTASTEYEGPSLSEQEEFVKTFLEEGIKRLMRQASAAKKKEDKDADANTYFQGKAARTKTETPINKRIARNVKGATARAKASGRSATGTTKAILRSKSLPQSTTDTLKSDAGKVGQRAVAAKDKISRRKWREEEYGKENASTEYEGPSLAEQVEFIKTFLEGKTTGGDPEATGARMGSFIKRLGKVAPKSVEKKSQQASRIAGKMAARASRQSFSRSAQSFRTASEGSENSSTEYEGPSLSEQSEFIKTLLEDHAAERQKRNLRRLSQEIESKAHGRYSDKERTKNPGSTQDRARTGSRGSNPSDPTLRRRRNRQASLDWKRKENK